MAKEGKTANNKTRELNHKDNLTNLNKAEEERIIDFSAIEKKWQKKWADKEIFEVKEDSGKKKFYCLEMYPYPSGNGLHVGHAFNYTIGDIYARYKRMQGFNVLHPIGFDSFGLPAENAAIKAKSHPKKFTEDAIEMFVKQLKALGLSYDWSRMVETHKPDYYKWDQWIFLKMLEKGLAYRKKSPVNWCPKCQTVLANEQVHAGKCWRHEDTDVEIKHLEQWFFKITKYADELYEGIKKLEFWPERIKTMQENWINKSEGTEILFEINKEKWPIFTTRPDTLFGVTFMVISAQHPRLMELVTKSQKREVENFLKKIKSTSEKDAAELEKEGVFTGSYATNPINGDKVPVWAGNFVVADYGSGMVMAVPAHDQRDFEFAKKYKIPIKVVVCPVDEKLSSNTMKEAYTGAGNMINSGDFDDLENVEAMEHITKALEIRGLGKKTVNYKLRDWLVSRQRFWGTPIPIIYCEKCGIVPVPENDLPVILPDNIKFTSEKNPLVDYKPFYETKCPKCGGKGRRETDTMDTFVNSSWYFLRYCDSNNTKSIFEPKKVAYWMPIDKYIGGAEHACMHLIYFRFYTKFLRDLGLLKFDEPTFHLFNQGMIHGEDGYVMSKSRGNVVDPLEMIKKYGADTLRIFLVSMASADKDSMWSSTGIESMHKFVCKIAKEFPKIKFGKSSPRMESKLNAAIKVINENIENFSYNLAVIRLRALWEAFLQEKEISKSDAESFLKIFSIFCPHIAEELWEKIGEDGFVSLAEWPKVDESKINKQFEQEEKAVEKTIADIFNIMKIMKDKENKESEKIYLYVIPNELSSYNAETLTKRIGKPVIIFAVNDKKKYDPAGKASKAKPGKPGIYVE
ncbi:MAG: leucine--tRNA ligase [Candidatus Pacearchaeota archaeon]